MNRHAPFSAWKASPEGQLCLRVLMVTPPDAMAVHQALRAAWDAGVRHAQASLTEEEHHDEPVSAGH